MKKNKDMEEMNKINNELRNHHLENLRKRLSKVLKRKDLTTQEKRWLNL